MKYKLTPEGYIYFYNAGISKMELRVLELLFDCESNLEVAERLFISEKAVKWHNTGIHKKLKVKSHRALTVRFRHFYEIEKQKTVEVEKVETEEVKAITTENLLALPIGETNTPLN